MTYVYTHISRHTLFCSPKIQRELQKHPIYKNIVSRSELNYTVMSMKSAQHECKHATKDPPNKGPFTPVRIMLPLASTPGLTLKKS